MRNRLLCSFLAFGFMVLASCSADDEPAGRVLSGDIETFAGLGPTNFGYDGDNGSAASARLAYVTGVATDDSDNVYITDGAANVVRKITVSNGTITTVAGKFIGFNTTDGDPYAGDGGTATSARLNVPLALTVDGSGNVYIADAGNHAIRLVTASTGKISTLAGKGLSGYEGDGASSTQSKIWNPYSIAHDASGNIYFADSQNHCIRKIEKSSGKIYTIAGKGPASAGYTGDNGPAVAATLNSPHGIAVGSDGAIYIADSGNNVIRKINSSGTINTLAGTGQPGYSGDNGPAIQAEFLALKGLDVDNENNVYLADSGNNVIRMISASDGKITTIAGSGSPGYAGDDGPALQANLSSPLGVALDSHGNIFIADSQNGVIRVVRR